MGVVCIAFLLGLSFVAHWASQRVQMLVSGKPDFSDGQLWTLEAYQV